jgi:adenine-specific DNA methylase
VNCWNCGHSEKLQKRAALGDWGWQIVLVERTARNRRELALASATEIEQADGEHWHPTLEFGCIPKGQETSVLIRHGFRRWEDLYPRRQRVLLETLLRLSGQVTAEARDWTALRMAICGSAEMAGFLSRWDRWYLKSYEAMAGHRFNFTTLPVEPNVWGAIRSGRGTVQRRLQLFSKASAWLQERLRKELTVTGPTPAGTRRRAMPKDCDACIVEGSSERISLRRTSADLILTDPPYHDDVQYDELSLPLRAWSKLAMTKLDNEAVVHATSGTRPDSDSYRTLLVRLFSECRRVLKPYGRLILSYANREPHAWVDLFCALQAARFRGLGYSIVHSENETDHAKRGVRACALDLIMELTPQLDIAIIHSRPVSTFDSPEAEFLTVVGDTFLRLGKLDRWEDGFVTTLKASRFLQGTSRRASDCEPTMKSGRT